MTRETPTREHAEGMLNGILSQRRMEGLTDTTVYDRLDLDCPTDRRVIGGLYASMALDAMPNRTENS